MCEVSFSFEYCLHKPATLFPINITLQGKNNLFHSLFYVKSRQYYLSTGDSILLSSVERVINNDIEFHRRLIPVKSTIDFKMVPK